MESKVNYTVVGIFVVVLGFVAIAIFFWFTAFKQNAVYKTYLVYVHEEVTGLSVDTPVRYNGVPVGFVRKVELDPNNPQLVRLTLVIEEGTPITTSTVAVLRTQGITGIIYVGLKAETEHAPLLSAKPGERYPVIPAEPSLLVQLSEVVPSLTKTMGEIGTSVNKLLSQKNRQAITDTLQSLATFTKTLSDNSKDLDASIKSLHTTLENTSVASKQLPGAIDQLNKSMQSIEQTSNAVKLTANQFSATAITMQQTFASGQAALNGFSTQVVPGLQQVMTKLDAVMANAQLISDEMVRNPSILVRGKKPDSPGPGEK